MTILGDWGTTRLRLFRVEEGGVVDKIEAPGVGHLAGSPAKALVSALAPWHETALATGVLLCGMAGSRNGLIEVPYDCCPADVALWRSGLPTIDVEGISISVAPGLHCLNFAGRADVMRGEETQIFGAVALDPALAQGKALIVLPGTHSKWAELIDGRIVRFHTFPTGELFALLRAQSTLTRVGNDSTGREQGFADGLARAGTGLIAGLFEARSGQLVDGRSLGWALGLLSGLLIGGEFAGGLALLGHRPTHIVLVGEPRLCALYRKAAEGCGLTVSHQDGDLCAIAGLTLLDHQEVI